MAFWTGSPIDLPGGRLACGTHHLEVCPVCCVDYTFMHEVHDDEDEASESDEPRLCDGYKDMRMGTGRLVFEKFIPPNPNDSPDSLFGPGISKNASPWVHRFIRHTNSSQLLIYVDGACLDNGQPTARAGCAFVFGSHDGGYSSFRLENRGPADQQLRKQTSNRAELRAVIAALRYRHWKGEGFNSLVIATDSEYVVEGATNRVRGWMRRGWKTTGTGASVKNQDLWKVLLGEAEKWSGRGMDVEFWRIPRELNEAADMRAKEAANKEEVDKFRDIIGMLV